MLIKNKHTYHLSNIFSKRYDFNYQLYIWTNDHKYITTYNSVILVNCTAGTYYTTSETNKPTCAPCGRGYYQPSEGQVTCLKCPTGKSTEDEMSKSSTQCIGNVFH